MYFSLDKQGQCRGTDKLPFVVKYSIFLANQYWVPYFFLIKGINIQGLKILSLDLYICILKLPYMLLYYNYLNHKTNGIANLKYVLDFL